MAKADGSAASSANSRAARRDSGSGRGSGNGSSSGSGSQDGPQGGQWRRPVAPKDTPLFPTWTARGQATAVPASEYYFKTGLKALASAAGMPPAMVAKLRPHSLRAGGCTDALAAGLDESWVQMQGGWLSSVFKIYYRPMAADMAHMFERLKTMEIVMAQ
jgi:integrase